MPAKGKSKGKDDHYREQEALPNKGKGKGKVKKIHPSTEERTKRKWEPEEAIPRRKGALRTPMAHRRGHINPNKLFKFVRAFPGIWKEHLRAHVQEFKEAKGDMSTWEIPSQAKSDQHIWGFLPYKQVDW